MKDTNIKEDCFEFLRTKLKALRKEKNFNQEQMAQILGLSRVAYVNIENGHQHLTADKIYVLCCVLGTTPNKLYPPIIPLEPKSVKVKQPVKVKYKTVYKAIIKK